MTGGHSQGEPERGSDLAVILHLYYPDLWDEMRSYLSHLDGAFDLHVTIPHDVSFDDDAIRLAIPGARIYRTENRGRDILPFLTVFSAISGLGYKYICKIHTKRSAYFCGGDAWRRDMLDKLLGSPQTIERIRTAMDEHPDWGLVAPTGHLVPLMPGSHYWGSDANHVRELASRLPVPVDVEGLEFPFVAGSMFWFRPDALKPVLTTVQCAEFEAEEGQRDGTLAHAFERFFGLVTTCGGYRIAESDARGVTPAEIPIQLRLLLQTIQELAKQVYALANPQRSIQELKDRHAGQTGWIIGKGPSLVMLSQDQIGDGPVIAINEAIIPIESMGLDNPLYSMQKDADRLDAIDDTSFTVTELGESYIPIKGATLLVHAHESPNRLRNYSPRFVFDNVSDFSLEWTEFSSLVAAAMAKLMGCSRVVFVAHDACVFGDVRKCTPHTDGSYRIERDGDDDYLPHRARIDDYLAKVGMPVAWLTPEGDYARRIENERAMQDLRAEIEELRGEVLRHDEERERLSAAIRRAEVLSTELELARAEVESAHSHGNRLREELELYSRRVEVFTSDLAAARAAVESAGTDLDSARADRQRLAVDLEASLHHIETLEGELQATRRHVDELLASKSWRLMAPLRAANRLLSGGRG